MTVQNELMITSYTIPQSNNLPNIQSRLMIMNYGSGGLMYDRFSEMLQSNEKGRAVVLRVSNEIVAWALVFHIDSDPSYPNNIAMFFWTDPAHRRKHYASKLLSYTAKLYPNYTINVLGPPEHHYLGEEMKRTHAFFSTPQFKNCVVHIPSKKSEELFKVPPKRRYAYS